jgi:multiple sugar transport system substrate-binding protein
MTMPIMAEQVREVTKLIRSFNRNEIDRREFMSLSIAFSAAAIAAACTTSTPTSTSSSTTSGSVIIPFYTNQNDPASISFFTTSIQTYYKTHANYSIPLGIYDDGTAPQFLTTAFQTGHDVGIFTPPPSFVAEWARNNLLDPLDDIVQQIGPEDFIGGGRMIINGHDYSIPYQANASGLWYRKDLFQQVGINQPPQTYDDLIATLKELNGRNGVIGIATGVGGNVPDIALHCMTPYVEQSGWGYFDKFANLTYNRDEVFQGIQRFVGVLKNTSNAMYNATYADFVSAYLSGKAAMVHYPGRVGNNLDANAPKLAAVTGFMPEPGGPFMTGKINRTGPRGYSVYSKTSHPTEARQFLKYLFTGQNGLAWALTLPGQVMPGLKSVLALFNDPTNPLVAANKYVQAHQDWLKAISDLLPTQVDEQVQMGTVTNNQFSRLANPNPFGQAIWKDPAIDATMIQSILLQGQDPSAAWKTAYTAMDTARKAFFKQNPNWKPASA